MKEGEQRHDRLADMNDGNGHRQPLKSAFQIFMQLTETFSQ